MSRLALEHNPGTGLVTRVGRKGFGHLSLLEFVVQGKRFLRKDRSCKFEHDNHDNLFIMNNVSFIFSTSKHNTECFSISFRARKNIMITFLEDKVCLCDHQIFSLESARLVDPHSKLSSQLSFQQNSSCVHHI